MPRAAPLPISLLMLNAQQALHMTQREFAAALGVGLRTVSRWAAGESTPAFLDARKVAPLLYRTDPELAREAARLGGTTLAQLGIADPPAPAAAPPPPPAPARPTTLLVDAIVYAAAEAIEASQGSLLRGARASVEAAFARARALGLSVDEVGEAFPPRPAPGAAAAGDKAPEGGARRRTEAKGAARG